MNSDLVQEMSKGFERSRRRAGLHPKGDVGGRQRAQREAAAPQERYPSAQFSGIRLIHHKERSS